MTEETFDGWWETYGRDLDDDVRDSAEVESAAMDAWEAGFQAGLAAAQGGDL